MSCLTFVIEVELRCGISVIPRDVLTDAASCKWRMRTVIVDIKPQRKRESDSHRHTQTHTHMQTDRPCYSVCSNSQHLMQCMRCGLIIIIIIIITKMTFIYADILHSRCVGGGKTVKTKEKLYLCQAELWRHSALLEGLTVTGSYTCTARALKSVLPDVLAIHTTEMTPKSSLQVTYWLMQTTVACSML